VRGWFRTHDTGRWRHGTLVLLAATGGWLALAVPATGTQPYETYENAVAASEPQAQYRFDDAAESSTLADAVGSDTATNSGITLGEVGPFGGSKAGSFGGEAYASLTSNPLEGAQAFTVEAWVDWEGGSSYKQPIFDLGSGSTNYMYLTPASSLSGHKMLFEIHTSSGSDVQLTAPKLTARAWEYVAVSETSSGTLSLYVGETEVAQLNGAGLFPSSLGSTPYAYLGKSLVPGEPDFKGSLSNVAFYTKALSEPPSEPETRKHYYAAEFPVNTSPPTISGTAEEGDTLKLKEGSWTGLTPFTFAYQWQRCNAKSECPDIEGASATEYTASAEDVGSRLRVAVTRTNIAGSSTASSAQTAVVAPHKPTNTELPSISGAAESGQLLTASVGSWDGTPPISYTYQWQACSSGGSCKAIKGATASSYRVLNSQIGDTLRLMVTASNTAGSTKANSAMTATIVAGPPVNTELPSISGTAQDGERLSVSAGAWAGAEPISYSYQWQRCYGSKDDCSNIRDATGATYVLGDEDVGMTPQAIVTATNSAGSTLVASEVAPVVEPIAPANVVPPEVSGTAQEGRLLTASTGQWSGSPQVVFSYQWQDCDSFGEDCIAIAGATGSQYRTGPADVGDTIRVEVTAVAINQASASSSSEATAPVAAGPYYVSQFAGTGEDRLDEPGDVALGASGDLWVLDSGRDRVDEFGENGERVLQAFGRSGNEADEFRHPTGIAVANGRVWVADSGHDRVEEFNEAGEYLSSLTATPAGPLGEVEGIAIDAEGNIWISDSSNARVDEFRADGEYVKTIGQAILGQPEEIAIDAKGDIWVSDWAFGRVDEFSESGELLRTVGSQGSGDGQLDHPYGIALDAQGDVWVGDVDNDRVEEFGESGEYLAQFGEEGSGEAQFAMEAPMGLAIDAGGDIWVTDLNNGRVQEWRSPPAGPANSLAPSITGEAVEGEPLSATDGTWSGAPQRYAYQWQRCDASGEECTDEEGARSQTYTPNSADVGDTVRVLVTAVNAGGSASQLSQPTPVVSPATSLSNTAPPAISGSPQDGQALSASTGAWSGSPPSSYAYQWQSCNAGGEECAPIEGANEAEYRLGEGDIGTTLRVVVTAVNAAGPVQATSAASAKVAAEAPSELEAPSIAGTPDERQVLRANPGAWAGTERQFSYQWESCSPTGVECAPIEGATEPEYDLGEGDISTTLHVRVGVSSAPGAITDVSAVTPPVGAAGALASTAAPSVAGTPAVSQALTASPGSWSASGALSYAYQWQSCDRFGQDCANVEGATGASYTPEDGDADHTLRVQVTASEEKGSSSRVSPATEPIATAGTPVVEQPPLIEGTSLQGSMLTVTPGQWSGEGLTYAFQWERCDEAAECTPIDGATSSSYTLTESDVGTTLRALVTATGSEGQSEALSAATAVIDPESLRKFSPPSISGIIEVGGELAAEPGIWSGTGPISYAYQWEGCNSSDDECAAIDGATEPTYLLSEGERGSTVRAKITVTGPLGSQTAFSAATVATPGGEVTVKQAEEAAQATDPDILAASTTANLGGETIAPALSNEEQLFSAHALTSSSVSKENAGEFAVNTPDGELSLKPLETLSTATTLPTIVNGTVALLANTYPATDTIIRPDALGAAAVLDLRSGEAPKSFTWEVGLGAGERLQQLPDGAIAVLSTPESSSESQTETSKEPESLEPGEEAPESPSESAEKAREEEESETEAPNEPPPLSPESSTTPGEVPPGELEPQNTKAQYEAATDATASAEAVYGDAALMVIEPPEVIDAGGHAVPASWSVRENDIALTIKPGETTTYPLLAAVSVAAPSDKASAERDPFEYGLADEVPSVFSNENVTRLHNGKGPLNIQTARKTIPWDVLKAANVKNINDLKGPHAKELEKEADELKTFEEWLTKVKQDGLTPYVTLKSDEINGPPPVPDYRTAFKNLIKRFGGKVKRWGAWNEPEQGHNTVTPERAGRYWQAAESAALQQHCGCTIVAGEFAQYETNDENKHPHENRIYAGKYKKGLLTYFAPAWKYDNKQHHRSWMNHKLPETWGFHDYADVVNLRTTNASEFEQFASGKLGDPKIWISEAGVLLHTGGHPGAETRLVKPGDERYEYEQQTKAADDFLELRHATKPHEKISRIKRVYYYTYGAPTESEVEENANEFDSGLFEAKSEEKGKSHGEARPAYCVLAYESRECPPTVVRAFPENEEAKALVNPHGLPTTVEFQAEEFGASSQITTGSDVIHPMPIPAGPLGPCQSTVRVSVVAKSSGGSSTGSPVEYKTGGCPT
jgi:sugar lactone lactonase YvrE